MDIYPQHTNIAQGNLHKPTVMRCFVCGSGLHEIAYPSKYLLCKNRNCKEKYEDTEANRRLCVAWQNNGLRLNAAERSGVAI